MSLEVTLVWLGGPAGAAALLTILTRGGWGRPRLMFWLGVAVALVYVLVVYLRAPHDYLHSQGDEDGEMFLGRWWEPLFVAFLVIVGYVFWAIGVVVGLLVRGGLGLLHDRARQPTDEST